MAEITLEQYRSNLLELAREPDGYRFLTLVDVYLAAVPLDHQIRATAIGLAVRKGLSSVAVELAAACPGDSPEALALRAAVDGLRRLPGDVVALETRRACFEHNLRALRRQGREEAELAGQIEEAWRVVEPSLALYQASDGNILARALLGGCRRWVPAALDFQRTVECLEDPESWKGAVLAPFLLESVGTGRLVASVYAASKHTYLTHSPPMFVIEPDLRGLGLALHLTDWSEPICDERFYLLAGQGAWEAWYELMVREENLLSPQRLTRIPRWPDRPASEGEAVLERLREHRSGLVEHHRRRVDDVYAGCDPAHWAQRFRTAGPGNPLRILGITSRFTTFLRHSMSDLLAAFERAGMETRLLIEERDHHTLGRHAPLRAAAEFRPDLLVLIDHHRHEYIDRLPAGVPYLCWIQDDLEQLMRPEVGSQLGPLDFTMGFGLTQFVGQYNYPAERFMPCKLAVNLDKLSSAAEDAGGPAELDCEVLYASHQSETPEAFYARWRDNSTNPAVRRVIEGFHEQHRALMSSECFNAGYDLSRMLREVEARVGLSCDPDLHARLLGLYVRPLVDRFLRQTTLAWAADWAERTGRRLHVYGNGWERHPTLARYARGPLEPGPAFGRAVRRAGISLHIGLNPALHQRVLETIGAGGFVLTRYCPSDFHDRANDVFWEYLTANGLDHPGRIPMSRFPRAYQEGRMRLAEQTNRALTEYVEITPELLLEQRTRRREDPRYHFADLAFPEYHHLTFENPLSFAERVEHFLAHPSARGRIAAGMMAAIRELFTYDVLARRVLAFITDRLNECTGAERMPSVPGARSASATLAG